MTAPNGLDQDAVAGPLILSPLLLYRVEPWRLGGGSGTGIEGQSELDFRSLSIHQTHLNAPSDTTSSSSSSS